MSRNASPDFIQSIEVMSRGNEVHGFTWMPCSRRRLVIQELLVRHRARTVLVVCPSSLQLKWQLEMQEKFGLEFRVVDTEYLKAAFPRA